MEISLEHYLKKINSKIIETFSYSGLLILDCISSIQEYKNDMENSTQTLGAELAKVNEEKNVSNN